MGRTSLWISSIFAVLLCTSLTTCNNERSSQPISPQDSTPVAQDTISGYISYDHHFYLYDYTDPDYEWFYSGGIDITDTVAFRLILSSNRPANLFGDGYTRHHIWGHFFDNDLTFECSENGWSDSQITLSSIRDSVSADSESIIIKSEETWYNPGRFICECLGREDYQGTYRSVENTFLLRFDLRDSSVVELDSTIDSPGYDNMIGQGTYRWIMRLDDMDSL